VISKNTNFILALIGALSWLPQIFIWMKKGRIEGKLISMYINFAKIPKDESRRKIALLFKLSIVSINKDFFLKDIDLKIRFSPSKYTISTTSKNWRSLIFTFDKCPKKLNVPDSQFLNNLSVLKRNTPEVGYLSFLIDYNKDEPIEELEFIFKSYKSNKKKILKFTKEDIKEKKLLFDDSVWANATHKDIKIAGDEE